MTSALKGATAAASASASAAAAERGRAACSPITISDSGSGSMEGSRRVTRSASNAGKAAPAVAAVAASAAAASVASAAATEAERKFKAEDRRFSQLSQPPSVGALPGEEILAQVPPSLPAARAKKKVRIVRTRSQVYAEFIKANNEAQRHLTGRERLYEEKESFEKELADMELEVKAAAARVESMHQNTIDAKKEHTASANQLRLIMAADDVTMKDVDDADRICSALRREIASTRERLLSEARTESGRKEKEKALKRRRREIDKVLPEIDAELDKLMDKKNEALGRVIELEKELAAMEDIDDVRRTTDHYAAAAAVEKVKGTKPKHFAAASALRPAKRPRTDGGGGGGGGGGGRN